MAAIVETTCPGCGGVNFIDDGVPTIGAQCDSCGVHWCSCYQSSDWAIWTCGVDEYAACPTCVSVFSKHDEAACARCIAVATRAAKPRRASFGKYGARPLTPQPEAWVLSLSAINGIGASSARAIAAAYPSVSALLAAYRSTRVDERERMLASVAMPSGKHLGIEVSRRVFVALLTPEEAAAAATH